MAAVSISVRSGWLGAGLGLVLAGCRVHLGLAPPQYTWGEVEVVGAAGGVDVGDVVRREVEGALAARGAHAPGGPSLRVEVLRAELVPGQRWGDALWYQQRLTVRFVRGVESVEVTEERAVPDPGSAAEAAGVRDDGWRALAAAVARRGVAWAGG